LPYLQYVKHLRQRPEIVAALDSKEAALETPYLDTLQRPLQPLKDHLEFSMYETFEKDPVKYSKYQEAIYLALKDGLASMEVGTSPRLITIAVAGAGRGPLVMKAIQAFKQLQAPPSDLVVKVYAIEKNPSAVIYLESMARHNAEWRGIVSVVQTDARNIKLSQLDGNQIDIVVSELLGSFGDNELSPECLDPLLASDCCKTTTVSIPMQCTAYLAPVASARLHADAKLQSQVPHEGAQALGIQRAMETAYVVRTHAASQTHAEQKCWSFQHPSNTISKERMATLEFAPDPTSGAAFGSGYGPVDPAIASIVGQTPAATLGPVTLHGMLGSFTAVLYARDGNFSEISIAPHRFSKGMFSWFPLYFPFKEPLHVPAGSNVSVKIWRKTGDGKVWYEWCAQVHRKGEILSATPIHNPSGRSSYVSM
jgi:protein arginine N-methyltransferase 5